MILDVNGTQKFTEKLPSPKKQELIKTLREKEDEIKRNLQMVNQSWND